MKLCKNCQSPFKSSDCRSVFCGRSCSATYLNKKHPKRKKTKVCRTCQSLVTGRQKYCTSCRTTGKHLKRGVDIHDLTIGEFERTTPNSGAGKYSEIRYHAKMLSKSLPNKCRCGYEKHVEVCHILPISKFSKDTLIRIINSNNNLVKLCPNCHWEFDNGLLTL